MMSLDLLLKTTLLLFVLEYCKGDDCFYYFTGQPSSEMSCNPWPLLTSTTTLPLHCRILAPKNNHLPNVEWYKDCKGRRVQVFPGGSDQKYSNPVSSGDLRDFKFVNFSLIIHNISDSDVGCYWCEVSLKGSEECMLDFQPSSQFCLLEESQYVNTSDCYSLALNEDTVCVANKMCDSNLQVNTQFISIIEQQDTITESNTVASLPPLTLSQLNSGQIKKQQDTIMETNTAAISSSLTPLSQLNSRQMTNSAVWSKSQPARLGSPVISHSQQELRIGLYIGVGVCCLLLVVILVLLAVVVVLCKAPAAKKHKKNVIDVSRTFPQPLGNVVWSRSNTSAMSLVNEGNVDIINSSSTQLADLQSTAQRDRGQTNEASFEPNASEREILSSSHECHTLSLFGESHNQCHMKDQHRTGSPDSHYYHVLEPPGYRENQDLLSQNQNISVSESQGCQQNGISCQNQVGAMCIIEGGDKDDEYRWKITPHTCKGNTTTPSQKKRHKYTRLDYTKMEPKNMYTQMNIK